MKSLVAFTLVVDSGHAPITAANLEVFPAIRLERTSLTGLTHVDGAISMARGVPTRRPRRSSSRSAISTNLISAEVQQAPTQPAGGQGAFGTETLGPTVPITRAFRK